MQGVPLCRVSKPESDRWASLWISSRAFLRSMLGTVCDREEIPGPPVLAVTGGLWWWCTPLKPPSCAKFCSSHCLNLTEAVHKACFKTRCRCHQSARILPSMILVLSPESLHLAQVLGMWLTIRTTFGLFCSCTTPGPGGLLRGGLKEVFRSTGMPSVSRTDSDFMPAWRVYAERHSGTGMLILLGLLLLQAKK